MALPLEMSILSLANCGCEEAICEDVERHGDEEHGVDFGAMKYAAAEATMMATILINVSSINVGLGSKRNCVFNCVDAAEWRHHRSVPTGITSQGLSSL
jgi:hypothetical protein